jgi:hypothetical protein
MKLSAGKLRIKSGHRRDFKRPAQKRGLAFSFTQLIWKPYKLELFKCTKMRSARKKEKIMIRNRVLSWLLLPFFLSGCATPEPEVYRAYEGPQRNRSEIAVIVLEAGPGALEIDGVQPREPIYKIELPPGSHTIKFVREGWKFDFVAEAGKSYEFETYFSIRRGVSTGTMWIQELVTGRKVSQEVKISETPWR